MARWNRIVGPPSTFTITNIMTTVPGMTITREYGQGVLLVLLTARLNNIVASPTFIGTQLLLDGDIPPAFVFNENIVAGGRLTHSFHHLLPITPGRHTLEWQINAAINAENNINANRCILTVIELPAWDADDAIV